MAAAASRGAVAASHGAARSIRAPVLDSTHQQGLISLLSQTYGKPVELNLKPIHKPYHDADILASYVTQQLKDRKTAVRRVIRDATWKAKLPSQSTLALLHQERQYRKNAEQPLSLADLTHTHTNASRIVDELELPQVSSVRVQAGGRLSKRITANRADSKFARRGATNKRPAPYVRGVRKSTITYAHRSGKRRIGAFGIKAEVGHS